MTPEDARRIALSLPQSEESSHMGRPDFRIGGRIFATLWEALGLAMAKLAPEQQEMLCAAKPAIFAPVPGRWGRRGATHIRLAKADEAALRSALTMAWKRLAPKPLLAAFDGAAPAVTPQASRPVTRRPSRPAPTSRGSTSAIRMRRARLDEALAISRLIIGTLRQSNAQDYGPAAIETMAEDFSANNIAAHLRERRVYVAASAGAILGTISLAPERIHSVFVDPSQQGRGIGVKMVRFVETLARREGQQRLALTSSLTAVGFYRKLGYEGAERRLRHGVETILVSKELLPLAKPNGPRDE